MVFVLQNDRYVTRTPFLLEKLSIGVLGSTRFEETFDLPLAQHNFDKLSTAWDYNNST